MMLGESLTLLDLVGAVTTFTGIIVVSLPPKPPPDRQFRVRRRPTPEPGSEDSG
jgi:hypothetical protein